MIINMNPSSASLSSLAWMVAVMCLLPREMKGELTTRATVLRALTASTAWTIWLPVAYGVDRKLGDGGWRVEHEGWGMED